MITRYARSAPNSAFLSFKLIKSESSLDIDGDILATLGDFWVEAAIEPTEIKKLDSTARTTTTALETVATCSIDETCAFHLVRSYVNGSTSTTTSIIINSLGTIRV